MNISPAKFHALLSDIETLKTQVSGLLTLIGSTASAARPRDPSIDGFCTRQGFSRGTYDNIRKQGMGPRETRISKNRIIITEEDEAAWIEARQKETARRAPRTP
jgi:hypothetical protein